MRIGDALYEFINRYAYFSNPANIVIENYSANDGNSIEADILLEFFRFLVELSKTQDSVKRGILSEEEADVKLRTSINGLRLHTVDHFLIILDQQIESKNPWDKEIDLDSLSEEQRKWLKPYSEKCEKRNKIVIKMNYVKDCLFQDIRGKIRRKSFSADQLVKFIEDIRKLEELLK